MKITDDVRALAKSQGVDELTALEQGLKDKSEEFARTGGALYS
jgi:phosphomethylpyrimidine synthase